MIVIKHRSASGRLDQMWEYDSTRRVLEIVLSQGNAKPVAFTLPVCAIDKPRLGAFAITRLDSDTWRVLPSMFVMASNGRLVHHERPIHPAIGGRLQLALSNAPYEVDAELEVLSL